MLQSPRSGRRDSNPRPIAWEAIALPLRHSRMYNVYGVYACSILKFSSRVKARCSSRGNRTWFRGFKELGIWVWVRQPQRGYWWLAALAFGLVLLLAGCSSSGSSGGTNITLGLAGSTVDQPSSPPTVAGNGPDATYAFVYDDQIWVHQSGNSTPIQITKLVLSNGADISFGPLVWSPDGSQIAFALVENLTPSTPSRTSGPIYVANVEAKTWVVTPGIGSIYGHGYAWYGPRLLFYASGDGISMYDVGDPDPRVWQVVSTSTSADNETFSNNDAFGDLAITNNQLFYSAATIQNLGGTGTIGTAGIYQAPLFSLATYNEIYNEDRQMNPIGIPEWLYPLFPVQSNSYPISLGEAYSDASGNITMGSWQLSADGSTLVRQVVDQADSNKQTVTSNFCVSTTSSGLNACQPVLSSAGTCSLSLHGQLSLSSDGMHIAYTCAALYVESTNSGSSAGKLDAVGWTTPATITVAKDGSPAVLATEIVSSSRDSSGVVHIQTNLVAFDGSNSYVLIKGAQSASWQ